MRSCELHSRECLNETWCARRDSNLHCALSERAASCRVGLLALIPCRYLEPAAWFEHATSALRGRRSAAARDPAKCGRFADKITRQC